MSSRIASAVAGVREAAARAAWVQWGAIFTVAGGPRAARAIVDPEALLLGSLALMGHEPRLWRVARLWARHGARLLSVQRAKNIGSRFPPPVAAQLGEFARVAATDGGDIRWRSLAGGAPKREPVRRREPKANPVLEGGPALMLRLRLGFGVGIKADVLAHLLGRAGGAATVQQAAAAIQYYDRAVRRAIEELAAAGFVEARSTAPASYRVDPDKWARLLAISPDDAPAWRPWAAVYAFAAALDAWLSHGAPQSAFVLASEARDLVAEHASALEPAGVRFPEPDRHRGEAYLAPFAEALGKLAEFLESAV